MASLLVAVLVLGGVMLLRTPPLVEQPHLGDFSGVEPAPTVDSADNPSVKERVDHKIDESETGRESIALVRGIESLESIEQQQAYSETELFVSQLPPESYTRWRPVLLDDAILRLSAPFEEGQFPETFHIEAFEDLSLVANQVEVRLHNDSQIASWYGTLSGPTSGRVELSVGSDGNGTHIYLKAFLGESIGTRVISISPVNRGSLYLAMEGNANYTRSNK